MFKSQKGKTDIFSYISPQTIQIIIYVLIALFFILIVKKVVDDLFNNPIAQGLAAAMGTASGAVMTIINGCATQTRCSKITNDAECESNDDCTYSNFRCLTTGQKEGSGGPFSIGCALYIGIIVYIFSFALGGITKFFIAIFGSKSNAAKQLATLDDKTYDEVTKNMEDDVKKDLSKVEFEFNSKNGREMTFKEKAYSVFEIARRRMSDGITKAINKIKDAQKSAEEKAKFEGYLKELKAEQEKISEGVNDKDINDSIDRVPEIPKEI